MNPQYGYIAFIVNPKSGGGDDGPIIKGLKNHLRGKGFDVRMLPTDSLEHLTDIACQTATDHNCGLVIAAGGDGTVREVAQALQDTGKVIMPLPVGNENLLAHELNIEERLESVINVFENGSVRKLDLGTANDRCFMCVAGIGFDAEVIERVSKKRQGHISNLDYFIPLWKTFWMHKFPVLRVSIDNEEVYDGPGLAIVGNISRYASGLDVVYPARYDDGLLDVCIYKCSTRQRLIKHSLNTVIHRHLSRGDVIYKRGQQIEISSPNKNVPVELDGDPGPCLPLKIKIIPQAVRALAAKVKNKKQNQQAG